MLLFYDFLVNGIWHLPTDLSSTVKNDIIQIQPLKSSSDVCVWTPSIDGKYSVKNSLTAHSHSAVP